MTTQDNTNLEAAGPVDPNTKAVANAATQTLFRFVSMRNPQLAKKDGNLKFIFRKEEYKGEFDKLLNDWKPELLKSKIDFLTEKIKSGGIDLSKFYRSEQSIKADLENLYTASENLIANGDISSNDIAAAKDTILDKRKKLWDSLIYQVFVQEDFYVKELLMHMLQTIHYAENHSFFTDETDDIKRIEKQKEIVAAKAVIPDYLLIDSATDDGEETTSSKYFTVGDSEVGGEDYISGENYANKTSGAAKPLSSQVIAEMQKRQNVALATYQKQQLEDLKKDLLKVQKQFRKNYQKQYDAEYKNYQTQIKPELEQYEQRLLEAEAGLEETASKASKSLALKRVQKPDIPDFEFKFENEQDYLRKRLSENALGSLSGLIGKAVEHVREKIESQQSSEDSQLDINAVEQEVVFPEEDYQSFDEILELVNEKLAESNEVIYQNTEVEKQQYASVGGVLIPVNKGEGKSLTPFTYNICCLKYPGTNGGLRDFNAFELSLNFPDNTWDISEIKHIHYENLVSSTFEKNLSANTIILNKLIPFQLGVRNGLSFPLEVHIFFSNGKNTILTIGSLLENTCEAGSFTISITCTDDPGTPDTPTNPGTSTSTTDSFVPKGFGIKRLGIADYLKVEQTTHAYVEGEVANIENIMAREYRSQSTRRLRRSETIDTKSSDTERERSTDTTTSSRFEMQSEISKILQEATDMGINANTTYSNETRFGNFSAQLGASYANHRSKEDSMRQAVTQAQEVTARALDRVVTKVHQERVEKMIEEFEENNTHGFDNRRGDQHVVGVYRWVDKLMKNRVWNYGKRMMFEFAIPQPSKLHTLAAASIKGFIEKPVDPRTSRDFKMSDSSAVADENTLKYWVSKLNVELEDKPLDNIRLGKSLSGTYSGEISKIEYFNVSGNLEIPEGYEAVDGMVSITATDDGDWDSIGVATLFGDQKVSFGGNRLQCQSSETKRFDKPFSTNLPVSATFSNYFTGTTNFVINCQITSNAKKQYQQKTFNTIIQAYEDALVEYNNKIAEEDAKASNIKTGNPMFYRQIE